MKLLLKRILWFFAVFLLIAVGLLSYAYFIEPTRLIVNENNLIVPNWSEKLNGFKVVAISDIHGGSNDVTEEKLRRLVELTNAQNPDLIVLLGDYISEVKFKSKDLRMPVEIIADNLQGFKSKYGVYAVIGNHDWWHDEAKIRREFERVGIKFLENEIEPVKINDETVWLWGIEDYWKRRGVPPEPFNQIPVKQNVIAITHNPDSLLKTPAGISLMLAGHSHGGQVSFPLIGALAWVNDKRFMAGETAVDGKHIFVTSGVGCTGPQIRFNVPPEIAVLNLSAQK